ncbi:MAG: hypothetical protein K2N33_00260 [Clostridia bacterium]|nr:hypothetical protein [Clostridia bacterium]MDE7305802.1 hypothetical protein [Clostridia bacterium]
MFTEFINNVYSSVASVPFDTLIWIIWGSFAALSLATLILCLCIPRLRGYSKRPYLCLVNAYAAITLAAYLTENGLPQSVLAAVLFWCVGYLAYGVLCFIAREKVRKVSPVSQVALSAMPVTQPVKTIRTDIPAAKSSVRLEHAISVTDALLKKNLGKGDRQELEKLKNNLAVLQMKGTLSPTESDILNENFNALLKLMAKYNV